MAVTKNASESSVRPGPVARAEQQCEAKVAALRTAIAEGDVSGISGGSSFKRVRQKLKLSKKKG